MIRRPPRSTRTDTLFPYTTLFRSIPVVALFLSGRPMFTNPEINAADAFVAGWLPGSQGAGVADVLIAGKDGKTVRGFTGTRSEERRVGKEGVSPCRSRGSPSH